MALAAQRLAEVIASGNLRHPDDETLNSHVLAAASRPVGEGWRFVKQRGKDQPIDGVIALAMANSAMIGDEQAPPPFESFYWGGDSREPRGHKIPRAEYVPCRGCEKPIHPSLHRPEAHERGLCMACRKKAMAAR